MASYLATIDIGRWVFRNGRTARGIPEVMAYDPTRANGVRTNKVFGKTAAITYSAVTSLTIAVKKMGS